MSEPFTDDVKEEDVRAIASILRIEPAGSPLWWVPKEALLDDRVYCTAVVLKRWMRARIGRAYIERSPLTLSLLDDIASGHDPMPEGITDSAFEACSRAYEPVPATPRPPRPWWCFWRKK